MTWIAWRMSTEEAIKGLGLLFEQNLQ